MHHKFAELFLPLSGFSGGLAWLFAQETFSWKDFGNLGGAVVIAVLLAYIITQRDPKAQEKVALLIETIQKENNAMVKSINEQHTTAIKHITEKHMALSEKTQQEYVIAMQGMVKDTKELVDSVVGKLIGEQRDQRKDLMAWTRGFELRDDKSPASGNDKKGFGP